MADMDYDPVKLDAVLDAFANAEVKFAAAASPPVSPPAGVVGDVELLRWFWEDYLPNNQQHFRVYDAASKKHKFRGAITTDRGHPSTCVLVEPQPEKANKSAFTNEEQQILIDGSLRGDRFLTWKPLVNDHHRQPSDVLAKESELVDKMLPEMWLLSRAEAYKQIKLRTHDGEKALKEVEWKEVVIWVNKGYVGLNPCVFNWSRSAERIRQEVRVVEDLDNDVILRLGTLFLEERRQATEQTLKKLVPKKYTPFRHGKKQTEESREKQNETKRKKREAEQGGAASASNVVNKKVKRVKKNEQADTTKGGDLAGKT